MTGLRVGLSGWDYPGWNGAFYPERLPARSRLRFVADHFDTVEVNGSFYSLQRPTTYRRWYDETPAGFELALKGGRFITHLKRLRDVDRALANFFASGPLRLDEKLGPLLWQLPATTRFDQALIDGFLRRLPRTSVEAGELAERHDERLDSRSWTEPGADRPVRHALEVRHPSFDDPRYFELLSRHGVANVVSDSPSWPMFLQRTSDLVYVRLHGHTRLYTSGYSTASLDRWADRCARWASTGPVHVYFDNDARGRAPYDALGLVGRLGGRAVTSR